jgi:regulator of sigma E protease
MDFLHQVVALIVTLGLLVTFHEYGHFWVARKCGVKVLRFSVGFGKPIISWYDRRGTEFAIAAIPLGGYVKMLDEREGPVSSEEHHLAFNRKSAWARIAIVAAGPVANFIFAFIAYWIVAVIGVNTVAPVIGSVKEGSVAALAGLKYGDEILSVDGEPTPSWQSVVMGLATHLGDSAQIDIEVRNAQATDARNVTLTVDQWLRGEAKPELLDSLGVTPFRPELLSIIGVVAPGGAAEKAGMMTGDEVISVNDEPIVSWSQLVALVRSSPEQTLHFMVKRDGRNVGLTVTPVLHRSENGDSYGLIGAMAQPAKWPEEYIRILQQGPLDSVVVGVQRTWSDIRLTLGAVKKLLVGDISLKTLSGPITIAQIAEESVSSGLESFLHFLAYLSVSLGVLNLLPIPVLDGGHLVYYFAEVLRGKPLSERVQLAGLKIGVAFILFMMVVAFYNDLVRLF